MCEAIARGLITQDSSLSITIAEPSEGRRAYLLNAFPNAQITSSNDEVVSASDSVVIAVKPQQLEAAFKSVTSTSNALFISICAGVPLDRLMKCISPTARIARVMPNLAAMVGEGASAFCVNAHCTETDSIVVRQIFTSVGAVVEQVSEHLMDAVTGISGSGPAFVCVFIEALADAGVKHGLSRETALRLAAQTCVGVGKMVLKGGDANHPAVIKDKVCSPGGTSIAGIAALEKEGFRAASMAAVTAVVERSHELGKL